MTKRSKAVLLNQENLAEIHFRSLVANRGEVLSFSSESYHAFKFRMEAEEDEAVELDTLKDAAAFFGIIAYPATGRKFCLSSGGSVGQVPADAQSGDEISFLLGLSVPFVIRKVPGEYCYTLVGECFTDGCLDESALERNCDNIGDNCSYLKYRWRTSELEYSRDIILKESSVSPWLNTAWWL